MFNPSTFASRVWALWFVVFLTAPSAFAQGQPDPEKPRLLEGTAGELPAAEVPPPPTPIGETVPAPPPIPPVGETVPAPPPSPMTVGEAVQVLQVAPPRPNFFQRLIAKPLSGGPANATTPPSTGCAACDSEAAAASGVGTAAGAVPFVGLPPLTPNFDASENCNCGPGDCVPGRREPCYPCTSNNCVGRFFCDLYECVCCPDPCYEPRWNAGAEAAFFVDGAHPMTTQRLRWDRGIGMDDPDRSEYFWARADGGGQGPTPRYFVSNGNSSSSITSSVPGLSSVTGGSGHYNGPAGGGNGVVSAVGGKAELDYDELSLYTESVISPKISIFTEMPYLAVEPNFYAYGSGIDDMNIGTKTLLFDCELVQVAFIFRTYLPIGNSNHAIGTGHVSLEPELVLGVKLAPETYFQGQIAESIPIGGDTLYEGPVMRINGSFNHVLCRLMPNVPLIGTAEFCTWSFQGGAFTDLETGTIQKASGVTYASAGPGLRLNVCDRFDFGVGTNFAVTNPHWAEQLYRVEFRFRF